jgi:hypothetical protein
MLLTGKKQGPRWENEVFLLNDCMDRWKEEAGKIFF